MNKNGYELINNEAYKVTKSYKKDNNEEYNVIRKDSLHRSKAIINDYATMNSKVWKSFVTLTFKDNITDLKYANKEFNKFISKIKRVYREFMYLGVAEFQKRGAVHYHLLTNISVGSTLCPLQEGKQNMYDIKYWNNGFTSVVDLSATDENFNPSAYMCKYLQKDLDDRLFGRKKVLKSNNLKKPYEVKLNINNEAYDVIYEYIHKNNINFSTIEIESNESFSIPFLLTKFKVSENEALELFNSLNKEEKI